MKMIKKYKENVSEYLQVCSNCKSEYTYQYTDVSYYSYEKKYYTSCPYCNKATSFKNFPKPMKKKYVDEIQDKESYEKIIAELREELTKVEKESHDKINEQYIKIENQTKQLNALDNRNYVLKNIANDIKSKITPVLRDIQYRKGVISKKMVVEHLQSLIDYIDKKSDNDEH